MKNALYATSPVHNQVEIVASLMDLPAGMRDKSIEAYLSRKGRPNLPVRSTIEEYNRSNQSIVVFNSVGAVRNEKSELYGSVFQKLLYSQIIRKSK